MPAAKTKTETKPLDPWQGPFAEYTIVDTPFGEYAIEAFKVLWFEGKEVWNAKTGEWEIHAIPQYRMATEAELKAARIEDAPNYTLPTGHPDKTDAPAKPDEKLREELKQRTEQLRRHSAARPGHIEE